MPQCALHSNGDRLLGKLIQTFILCRRKRRRRENCQFNHLIAEWGYHHFRCVSSIRSHNHSVTSDRELKARWTDRACMSPMRFADVNASSSAVFKETYFMSTVSRGSNGGPVRARNTTSRSQAGMTAEERRVG